MQVKFLSEVQYMKSKSTKHLGQMDPQGSKVQFLPGPPLENSERKKTEESKETTGANGNETHTLHQTAHPKLSINALPPPSLPHRLSFNAQKAP